MVEIYIINGREVDLTNVSQTDKIIWLSKNPGAELKKVEGATADVNVALPNMFTSQDNGELVSEDISLVSQNSEEAFPGANRPEAFYEGVANSLGKRETNNNLERNPLSGFTDINVQLAVDNNFITNEDLNLAGYTNNQSISVLNPPSQSQINEAKKKIKVFQSNTPDEIDSFINISKLNKPFIYEDDYDPLNGLNLSEIYPIDELAETNININDFGGFMQDRGFDKDLQRFLELDLDKSSYGNFYDSELAYETKKLGYLNMYINDQLQRDIQRQKFEYEKSTGIDPNNIGAKFTISDENVKLYNYENLIKEQFPLVSEKLQEQDEKNQEEYEELIANEGNISTGKFLGNIIGEGWNGISDAISNFSASAYGIMPGDFFEGVSESIRTDLLLEDTYKTGVGRYVTAMGYEYTENGIRYVIDANNRVINTTYGLDATPFLTQAKADEIRSKARRGNRKGTSFSTLGAFDAGANVVGDLVFQLALTRGVGIARASVGGFTKGLGVLGKTKKYLKSIPMKSSMADAIIAQSTLGFSRGYEETLKLARAAGIPDDEAGDLATIASLEMGLLYALTAPISPQTRATDALFGKIKKDKVIKIALDQYAKKGKEGFKKYLTKLRTAFNVTGEGVKEVFQENVQQAGEVYGVNRDVNDFYGGKLLKDTISGQDFADTIVLSFFAGALIPGAGVTLTAAKKSARSLLGMDAIDRFNALSYMAAKKKKTKKLLAKQVDKGIYTQEEANQIIEEMDAFNNNINRMPAKISATAAEKILGDLNTLGKLREKIKTEDKSFRPDTQKDIDLLEEKVRRTYYDDMSKRTADQIIKAIKDNTLENTIYKEFESTIEAENYLVEEYGYSRAKAKKIAGQYGIDIQLNNGKQFIGVNNELASKDGKITTKLHEFLHGIIYKTIKGDPEAQRLIGNAFTVELLKLQEKLIKEDSKLKAMPDSWLRRFQLYIDRYSKEVAILDNKLKNNEISKEEYKIRVEKAIGNQWEEALPLYSEAIANGAVTYDEDVFTKLKDVLRQVLQYLGASNIEFSSGRDVYNFIKDYNATIEAGNFNENRAFKKLTKQGAKVDKDALKKEIDEATKGVKTKSKPKATETDVKEEIEEKIEENIYDFDEKFSMRSSLSSDEFRSKINSFYNKNKWGKKGGVDSVLYDVLGSYSDSIYYKAETLYGNLPDYSAEDMISETQIALIPHIRNFNKEFLRLRENKRKQLEEKGLSSNEINSALNKLDVKGYKNSEGKFITENNNLNGWINAQLRNKMKIALKTGSVTSQKFTEEFDASKISDIDQVSNEEVLQEEELEFEENQEKLVELLKDPIFGFVNEDGNDIEIEAIPQGGSVVFDVNDPSIPANKKLLTEQDPEVRKELQKELKDLKRGLELENKENLTVDELSELKELKSFKSYDLMFGLPVKTFKALSELTSPAQIIISQVKKQILNAPNIETLDFKNFKEKLSTLSKTLARRVTFKNRTDLDSFMYNNWELIWGVINNPIDPITGQSTYDSKKTPPRLKAFNEEGKPTKMKPMTRVKFLQSFYGLEETTRLIRKYGGNNINEELSQLEDVELNAKKGTKLWPTALFDRRTSLMERFGDVIILQEGRNALRDKVFLKKIADKNVDLYNILKDESTKAQVISNLAQGKSDIVKFSLNTKSNLNWSDRYIPSYGEGTSNPKKLDSYLTTFTVNNKRYEMSLMPNVKDKKLSYDFSFQLMKNITYERDGELLTGQLATTDITGTGNPFQVMSIVIDGLTKAVNKFNIQNINFDSFDTSRSKLYRRLVQMFSESSGLEYKIKNSIGIDTDDKGISIASFSLSQKDFKKSINKIANEKFSLAEKNNGKISSYLNYANDVEQQFYMGRILDGAKIESIKYNKRAIKFNVPDLGDLNDKAVSYYLLNKINEGYNDFYFRNNKNSEGVESKKVLEIADVKFSLNNERNEYAKNLSQGLNEIIQDNNKNIDATEVIGKIIAERAGKNKGKYDIWLPAADQDFLGLMYMIGNAKGAKGEKQLDYLRKALINPYSEGMLNLMQSRQAAFRDWKNLIKNEFKGIKKTLKQNSGYEDFTNDEAIRVYLWNSMYAFNPELDNSDLNDVTGLTPKDVFKLSTIVRKNETLKAFAQKVKLLSKQPNGYLMPTENWADTTILNDVQNNLSKVNRKKYLVQWQENVDLMFTKENLAKLEYAHGTRFVDALNDILERMKTGSNKPTKNSAFIDWVNGSIGVTMFFNMRSALLQTISASNFVNTSDNNIFKASAALANVPQVSKDFLTLWNSDYLKDRRAGLMSDIQEAEILDVLKNPKYNTFLEKGKAGIFYLLKQGYTLTRAADAFAIASGGAVFYRNRIKSLVKGGMDITAAEEQAYKDFYETAEISQQSADPSKISKNQAAIEGRLILSFMNTPLQYGRIIKKAATDIIKKRGNFQNNMSKILYYAVLQNVLFNYLQQGLMAKMWGDEDDEDWAVQNSRFYEGWVGTLLKGSGLKMAVVAGVTKLAFKTYDLMDEDNNEQNKSVKLLLTALDISPPIGIKSRKFVKSWNAIEYNKAEAEWLGWSLDNPYYIDAATTFTSAAINLPLDRMYQKFQNLEGAMNQDYENYQRAMLFLGYNKYNLGLDENNSSSLPPSLLKLPKLKVPKLKFPKIN